MMRRFTFLTVCVLVAFPFSVAEAMFVPQIELAWSGGGEDGNWIFNYTSDDVTVNGDNSFNLESSFSNGYFEADWTITYDPDPYIIVGFNVSSTLSVPQLFTFTVTIPVDELLFQPGNNQSSYGGDMGGSFTTDSQGGTLSTDDSSPLYYGIIDGIHALPFYWDYSLIRTSQGTTNIPHAGKGLPPEPSIGYGGPADSIGVEFKFVLEPGGQPGDVVAMTGYFEVVPEPATIILFGLGGLVFLGKRH